MVEVEQIMVLGDPESPDFEAYDIEISDIVKYGETLFPPGIHVKVFLSNGEEFSCAKDEDGWDVMAVDQTRLNIATLPKRTSTPLTFLEMLDLLLTEAETKDITGFN